MLKWTNVRNKVRTCSVSLIAIGFLLGTGPLSAQAQEITKEYRIVTLGDSITVGYEPGLEDVKADPYGYVERLEEQALLHGRAKVSNYGIAGLKTSGLLQFTDSISKGEKKSSEAIQPALVDPRVDDFTDRIKQIQTEVTEADVIAITIGGNDVSELLVTGESLTDAQLSERVKELLSRYSEQVTSSVNDLHALNEDALFVIADQYQPLPKVGNEALYNKLMGAAALFTDTIDTVASQLNEQGVRIKVAHVAKEFVGGEGTMTHMIRHRDFHPNQYGYEAIAEVFAKVIWGDYVKLQTPDREEPMNIFVSGKQLITPYKPVLKNNQNYIAIQDIVEAVSAESKWDNQTKSTKITYGTKTVEIKMGSKTVLVNDQSIPVATPAFLQKVGKESKTYVPLALVAENLGFDVQYQSKLKTVFINP
ncbi:stalk domain-containing protein [Paenibacillus gallinarum]|uniref:Copper amine oxidase n=1 Tax=Paenibacillus gallinarum TaxID=2762232 RepID=A0ABR8SZD3_9BACL|nr:stalk domain-containing protein [Paenibacillus gallinarum]MBD7968870.1 copper amine oxidase [Paenibacillus gallinarum]